MASTNKATKKSAVNDVIECKECSGRASSQDFFGDERPTLLVSRIVQQGTNDETESHCCEITQFEWVRKVDIESSYLWIQ